MQIKEIELKNFCQHSYVKQSFNPGITGFLGPNGVGKSNFLKAVQFIITGEMVGTKPISDYIKWGCSEAFIKVDLLTAKGLSCNITRIIRRDENDSMKFVLGGETIEGISNGYNKFHSLLNVTPKMLEIVAFLGQGELGRFLFDQPAERRKHFQRLLGTAKALRRRYWLKNELDKINNRDFELDLDTVTAEIKESKENLAAIKTTKQRLEDRVEEIAGKSCMELGSDLINKRRDLRGFIQNLEQEVKDLKQELEEQDDLQAFDNQEYNVLKETVEAYEEMPVGERGLAQDRLEQTEEVIQQFVKKLADNKKAIKDIEDPASYIQDLSEHGKHLGFQVRQAELLLKAKEGVEAFDPCPICGFEFEVSDGCPTCNQPIEGALPDAQKVAELASERKKVTKRVEDIKRTLLQIEGLRERLREVQETRDAAQKTLLELFYIPKDSKIKEDRERFLELQDIKNKNVSVESAIKTLNKQIEFKVNILRQKKQELTEIDNQVIEKYLELKEEKDKKVNEISRLSGQESQLQATLNSLVEQKENIKQRADLEKRKKEYQTFLEEARFILKSENLPNLVARSYRRGINEKIEKYLKIFDTRFSAWLNEEMEPVVSMPGASAKDTDILSGGQRVTLSLAFSIAVWELLLPNIGFLSLDEPTHFLDNEHVGALINLFRRLSAYCQEAEREIFIITHQERLKNSFDYFIKF